MAKSLRGVSKAARKRKPADDSDILDISLSKVLNKLADDVDVFSGRLSASSSDIVKQLTPLKRKFQNAGRDFGKEVVDGLNKSLISKGKPRNLKNLLKELEFKGLSKELITLMEPFVNSTSQFINGVRTAAFDASQELMKPFDKLTEYMDKIPVFGKFLKGLFNFEEIREGIQKNIQNTLTKAIDTGVVNIETFAEVGKTAMSGIGNAAKAALAHPVLLALALIIGAIVIAFNKWKEFYKVTKTIRDETGLLADESMRVGEMAREAVVAGREYGVTMELAGKSASALVNEYQSTIALSQELLENTSLLVSAIGMSAEEAAKLQRTFKTVGQLSDENAGKLALATANAARLGKVAPAKVLSDLAKSSKEINLYFRGNVKEAAKAAIELARMGLSLQKAAGIAKGLLEFDTSIEAELEASVLMGRQMNLGLARQYAFMGDIENATKQVLKQVGSLDSFNRMNVLQKEAVAKAAGMEVDELANALQMQEEIASMSAKERQDYEKGLDVLKKFREENKKNLLEENSRLLATEKLAAAWDKIVYLLSSVLFPIFDMILPIVDEISKALRGFFDSSEGKEFIASLQTMGKVLADIAKVILPVVIRYVRMFIDPFIQGINIIGKLLSGDFSGALLGVTDLFSSIWKNIFNVITLPFQYVLAFVDRIFGTKLLEPFQKAVDWLGTTWGTIYSLIYSPIGMAIALIKDGWQGLADYLKSLWDKIYNTVIKPFVDAAKWIGGLFGLGKTTEIKGTIEDKSKTASQTATTPTPMATGGIVTSPQVVQVGEKGAEAIIPLDELQNIINNTKANNDDVVRKLEEVKNAILSMRVYMDSKQVGYLISDNLDRPGRG